VINSKLNRVAVDLTPIRRGGENGGAKIFVLELLNQLANVAPDTEFVLLTQAASHDELAALDRSNVRRLLVVSPSAGSWLRKLVRVLARHLMPCIPRVLKGGVTRFGYRLNHALQGRGAKSLMQKIDTDLLFCPFTAPTFYSPGVPTVCTIYDLQYKTYPEFFSPEDVAHRDLAFTEACRKADALVAISNFSRDEAIAYGKLSPIQISTIYLRTAKRFENEKQLGNYSLEKSGLSPKRYLLYPANFWLHKNHENLIGAFKMACQTELDKDIKLVCTGSPDKRQDCIISMAIEMGISGRIIFPGYLSNSDLSILMKNSAGLIFPSLYEGFGMPVVEAMAAGVPVACSNTTSLPEVVDEAAILFDPHDPSQIVLAMTSLVKDEALRARLIQTGLQRAAEFSDSMRMAREYWEIFLQASARRNSSNSEHIDLFGKNVSV
jgi:glycosyltransferase involved in cell wall biosynthesis